MLTFIFPVSIATSKENASSVLPRQLDAFKGYHQCPLDKDDHFYYFGHYKFLLALISISSISEHYDHRMYEAFQGLSDFRRMLSFRIRI